MVWKNSKNKILFFSPPSRKPITKLVHFDRDSNAPVVSKAAIAVYQHDIARAIIKYLCFIDQC